MAQKKSREVVSPQVVELLYQGLETEQGGVEVYRMALKCVQNEELREEWKKYLSQTEEHVEILTGACKELGLDPTADTPGRQTVRTIGTALVKTMQLALGSHTPEAAELVAAECVVHAETKDHMNWSLLGKLIEADENGAMSAIAEAVERVEDEEDEHLYHSEGWARELWLSALGLPARLPPPEEEEDVHSQEDAALAKHAAR